MTPNKPNNKVEEIEAELNLLLTEYWNTEDRSRTANVLEAVEKALTSSYEQGVRDERGRILDEPMLDEDLPYSYELKRFVMKLKEAINH